MLIASLISPCDWAVPLTYCFRHAVGHTCSR